MFGMDLIDFDVEKNKKKYSWVPKNKVAPEFKMAVQNLFLV
jgi:hypothetical protein